MSFQGNSWPSPRYHKIAIIWFFLALIKVTGFRPRLITWKRVGATPRASTAAAQRGSELLPGGTAEQRNRGVLGMVCWWPCARGRAGSGKHSIPWPSPARAPSSHACLCPMPPSRPCLALPPCPSSGADMRPRWTITLRGVWLLFKWPKAGVCTQLLLLTHGKQMEEGWQSLPWAAAGSQQPSCAAHKASGSKALKTPHAPAATSRSSKVPAGALWAWTLHPLLQSTSVMWGIWQLTASFSAVWRD